MKKISNAMYIIIPLRVRHRGLGLNFQALYIMVRQRPGTERRGEGYWAWGFCVRVGSLQKSWTRIKAQDLGDPLGNDRLL